MSQILNDGTVIPSYLSVSYFGEFVSPGTQDSISLRLGEVKEIIYPEDEKSVSKRFTEYTVDVQQRDGNAPGTNVVYYNCVVSTLFGTSADFLKYTLRSDKQQENAVGKGAKVLLLCINGSTTKGVIVGAIRDTGTDPDGTKYEGKDSKEDGHNLNFEFNGIKVKINKSGELNLTFRGATKVDGTLSDEAIPEAEGTQLQIDKNGSITASTPESKQFLKIDHENKKIEILADTEWNVKVNEKSIFDFGKSWEVSVGDEFKCSIQKDVTLNTSSGKIDIGASGNVNIKSAGLMVGNATDSMMKGTTYRNAESTQNNQLMSALTQLAGFLTTAGVSITAASGLHSIPVAGPIIGAAPLTAAATALTSAATAVSQMISAITSFEGQSATYLSTVNKND